MGFGAHTEGNPGGEGESAQATGSVSCFSDSSSFVPNVNFYVAQVLFLTQPNLS